VLAQLQRLTGEGIADERVIVRVPAARGITADEAILLHQNVLLQVQSGPQGGLGVGGGMSSGETSDSGQSGSQSSSGSSQGSY
jgi:hypothetical protein